jgi:hypothetical protein
LARTASGPHENDIIAIETNSLNALNRHPQVQQFQQRSRHRANQVWRARYVDLTMSTTWKTASYDTR